MAAVGSDSGQPDLVVSQISNSAWPQCYDSRLMDGVPRPKSAVSWLGVLIGRRMISGMHMFYLFMCLLMRQMGISYS